MKAYAKINLVINNLGKVGNLHKLDMIISEIDLYDEVNIIVETSDAIDIDIIGMPYLRKEDNLMYKAAYKYLLNNNLKSKIKIYIEKNIPIEAGLGGGSSDACAVLKLLNAHFKCYKDNNQMISLAKELGSDVPFFLYGGICRVGSFGEKISKISDDIVRNIIVVKPGYGLSTKEVFEASDKKETVIKKEIIDEIERSIKNNVSYQHLLFNDLEECANNLVSNDDIYYYIEVLKRHGAINSLMSGSGSTVYGFFEKEDIDKKYANIKKELKNATAYKF